MTDNTIRLLSQCALKIGNKIRNDPCQAVNIGVSIFISVYPLYTTPPTKRKQKAVNDVHKSLKFVCYQSYKVNRMVHNIFLKDSNNYCTMKQPNHHLIFFLGNFRILNCCYRPSRTSLGPSMTVKRQRFPFPKFIDSHCLRIVEIHYSYIASGLSICGHKLKLGRKY